MQRQNIIANHEIVVIVLCKQFATCNVHAICPKLH